MPPGLLSVRDLSVAYVDDDGRATPALTGIDLEVREGEAVGLLGESGCGKSTLCLTLLGLLPGNGRVTGGAVRFAGRDLLSLPDRRLDRLRGDRLAIVFQEPGLALNPCLSVGAQIEDVLGAHRRLPAAERRRRVLALLARVGFDEPAAVRRAYPHQLSGGQQQRAILAQALVCRPALLIADEPTAALDAVTEADLVELLHELRRELGMALLFVSHDPALLAALADRLLVLYAGGIAESGGRAEVLGDPRHPYTRELLRCLPPAGAARPRRPLPVIPGPPPDPRAAPSGCVFEPRCPDRLERCAAEPPPAFEPAPGRRATCWLLEEET